MNKVLKSAFGVVAAAAVVGTTVIPAIVTAYGDNYKENGVDKDRPIYTVADIDDGLSGDKIFFNSIVDTTENALTKAQKDAGFVLPMEDERNFVSALPSIEGDKYGSNVKWNGNDIVVEEGKSYLVRLYVHNNSIEKVAKDVKVSIQLPNVVGTTQQVEGYINSSNANPSRYWDYVNFTSDRNFYLDYVEGSATYYNNIWKDGKQLSDALVTNKAADTYNGVALGYDSLNGEIPGCYKYSGVVVVKVKPVFEDTTIQKTVRLEGTKEWKKSVDAKIGDKVEYQIRYSNVTASETNNVIIEDSLPQGLKYVAGTTKLFNANLNWATVSAATDKLTTVGTGVNVGGPYAVLNVNDVKNGTGSAFVRFTAEVVDEGLVCGTNRLINWAKASAAGYATQNSADVYVVKKCDTPTPTPPPPPPPEELPSTGPAAVVTGVMGAGAVATAAGYYIASRKQLRK